LPARALKPYLSYTSRRKGRAGRVVGGKISGKIGGRGERGGTSASGLVTAFI
jgi:hypothetical protein